MQLSTMRARIADALSQPVQAGALLTPEKVTAAIQRAYVQFALDTECFSRAVALTTTKDTPTLALPGDVHRVRRVRYGAAKTLLARTERLLINDQTDSWDLDAGTPASWWQEPATVRLYPMPTTDDVAVLLDAVVVPVLAEEGVTGAIPQLEADDDAPALPCAWQDALWSWAGSYLALRHLADDPLAVQAGAALQVDYVALVKAARASVVE